MAHEATSVGYGVCVAQGTKVSEPSSNHIFFIVKLTYATYYTREKDSTTKNVVLRNTDNELKRYVNKYSLAEMINVIHR